MFFSYSKNVILQKFNKLVDILKIHYLMISQNPNSNKSYIVINNSRDWSIFNNVYYIERKQEWKYHFAIWDKLYDVNNQNLEEYTTIDWDIKRKNIEILLWWTIYKI